MTRSRWFATRMKAHLSMHTVETVRREHTRAQQADVRTSMMHRDDAAAEWQIVLTVRPNAMVIGAPEMVEASLASIEPLLMRPVYAWIGDGALPPSGTVATLIVKDVEQLSLACQEELFAWLDQHRGSALQVISTTGAPMLPLLLAGRFLEDLYYRLNTVVLDAHGPSPVQP